MRNTKILLYALIILLQLSLSDECLYSQAAEKNPAATLSGRVLDNTTGEPLNAANVYIAKTLLGAPTNSDGHFIIYNVPYGTHQILVSYIGYKVYKKTIRIDKPEIKDFNFQLERESIQLDDVVVTPEIPKNWDDNLRLFKELFLGISGNAEYCTIMNPEVLKFSTDKNTGMFKAEASDILLIENKAMGYNIKLVLEEFSFLGKELKLAFTPVFEELEPRNKEEFDIWKDERERAYKGSLRHLLASILSDRHKEEGYILRTVKSVSVDEEKRESPVVSELNVAEGINKHAKILQFEDILKISYIKEREERKYFEHVDKKAQNPLTYDPADRAASESIKTKNVQTSYIKLKDNMTEINLNGTLVDPFSVTTYGYMAWERIAEELPNEYKPENLEGVTLYWEKERPEYKYFVELEDSAPEKFKNKFELPLLVIFNEEEIEHYKNLSDITGKKEFIKRYIKSRNQNPLYAVNYWFLEFIGRYYHATKEFAIKAPPYFDDRGVYYIKYGRPSNRHIDRGGTKVIKLFDRVWNMIQDNGVNAATQMRKMFGDASQPSEGFVVKPNETWYYYNNDVEFTVHFVKEGGFRKVESLSKALTTGRELNIAWQWMELVKERDTVSPAYMRAAETVRIFEDNFKQLTKVELEDVKDANIYVFDGAFLNNESFDRPHAVIIEEKLGIDREERISRANLVPNIGVRFKNVNDIDFVTDVAQFRNERGDTRLEMSMFVPVDEIINKRYTPDASDSIKIEYQYLLRDNNFNQLITEIYNRGFSLSGMRAAGLREIIVTEKFPLQPVEGDFTLQLIDDYSSNVGFKQQPVTIRDFSGDNLMISDIQLYGRAISKERENNLPVSEIESFEVIPFSSFNIDKSQPLFYYFEIYNIYNSGIRGNYKIEFKAVKKASSEGALKRLIKRIIGASNIILSIDYMREFTDNNAKEFISLDLGKLKKGEYSLEITVSDPADETNTTGVKKDIVIRN